MADLSEAELEQELRDLMADDELVAELREIWGSLAAREAALDLEDSEFDDA